MWAEGEISPDCEPEVEEVEGENVIRASKASAMFGALQQKFKNQYLEELKKEQAATKSDSLKVLGKKFQFKL